MRFTAAQIAQLVQGIVEGNPQIEINAVAKIEEGHQGALSFLANPKYEPFLYTTKSSVILVSKELVLSQKIKATLIRVEDPYSTFSRLLELYQEQIPVPAGIEQPSFVHPSVVLDVPAIYVGAFAYVGQQTRLAKNVKIYPQVYIGENVEIGENTIIYAGAKIYPDTIIGKNCIIHAGAVIGSDGFGFAPKEDGSYHKIPQIGRVIIEDEVEIGANTTIDRATMGATKIDFGVKIDNLVQIGHNVQIGKNTVMAAQTGIAGSSKIGGNCMIGGQVGISGHLQIADEVKIIAQSGISKNVKEKGSVIQGAPAFEQLAYNRSYVYFKQLPELFKKIEQLLKKNEK